MNLPLCAIEEIGGYPNLKTINLLAYSILLAKMVEDLSNNGNVSSELYSDQEFHSNNDKIILGQSTRIYIF